MPDIKKSIKTLVEKTRKVNEAAIKAGEKIRKEKERK